MKWSYLSGPLVGAVIGYFTNYLAVKMMFHPRKEIRIFGFKLPFTPGAIPKGKPRLARAIGEVVGKTLLTEEDIRGQLLDEKTEERFVSAAMNHMNREIRHGILNLTSMSEENYEAMRTHLVSELNVQILDSLEHMQIGQMIAREGKEIIKNKVAGTMLAMFLSDEMLDSLVGPIGAELETYMMENGAMYLEPEVDFKLKEAETSTVLSLLDRAGIREEQVRAVAKKVYHEIAVSAADEFLKRFQVSALIEEKINEMDVRELEDLVLLVMKKELDKQEV
jgi:uncharacterized membrane protein YheB (UPF0754 family)